MLVGEGARDLAREVAEDGREVAAAAEVVGAEGAVGAAVVVVVASCLWVISKEEAVSPLRGIDEKSS